MNLLIHDKGRIEQFDENEIGEAISSGKLSRHAMVWHHETGSWRPLLVTPNRSNGPEQRSPIAVFSLSFALVICALLYALNSAEALPRVQDRIGPVMTVMAIASGSLMFAAGGVYLAALLWAHPGRMKGSGLAGPLFLLSALFALYEVIEFSRTAIQLPDITRLITAWAQQEDARIVALGDGVVALAGTLGPNLVQDFLRTDRESGPINMVRISSPGGLVEPALELAKMFESRRITVVIEGECSSACLLLAVASPRSFSEANVVFGFHRVSPIADADSEIVLYSVNESWIAYRAYLESHGVPSSVMDEASKHGPSTLHPVPAFDMANYGAIKGIISEGKIIYTGSKS